MFAERKDGFFGKHHFPKKRKGEKSVMKSNNQLNVPQAKAAMEQFKMQAAQDLGVLFTY